MLVGACAECAVGLSFIGLEFNKIKHPEDITKDEKISLLENDLQKEADKLSKMI